jgi:hypothetical protein
MPRGHIFVLEIESMEDGKEIQRFNLVRMEKEDVYDIDNWRAYEFYLWVGRSENAIPIARIPDVNLGNMNFTATVSIIQGG